MLAQFSQPPARGHRFFLVRHGHSVGNAQNILQGHKDYLLSELGHRQTSALAEAMQKVSFKAIVSSDLKRASQTASILAGDPKKVLQHRMLRERNFGQFEGRSVDSYLKEFASQMAIRDQLRPHEHFVHRLHPEIETDIELAFRMRSVLEELKQQHESGNMLLVSHAATIRAYLVDIGFAKANQFGYDTIENLGFCVVEDDGQTRKVVFHQGIIQP